MSPPLGYQTLRLPKSAIACLLFETLGSTNSHLAEVVNKNPNRWHEAPLALVAETQTAGRGRRGNQWQSYRGNLNLSLFMTPARPVVEWSTLGLVAALSVGTAIRALSKVEVALKWPNDVLVDGAKISGILPEVVTGQPNDQKGLIVGIGLNIGTAPILVDRLTTSIRALSALSSNDPLVWADEICAAFLVDVARWSEHGFEPFRESWLSLAYGLDKTVTIRLPQGSFLGRILTLRDDGALRVELEDGTIQNVTAGEVFFDETD